MMKMFLIMAVLSSMTALAADVKFAKPSVSVKESAAYAEISVTKSGKDAARVRFATVSGTAKPGSEYYATNGILAWAANKTGSQKIRVRLMPDLIPVWEPNKAFSIKLEALDESELADGESRANVTTPTAAVTITESSKRAAGKVCVTARMDEYGNEIPFENPGKPSVTLEQNGMFDMTVLRLDRTGGRDGEIAVSVSGVDGQAKLYRYDEDENEWTGDYMIGLGEEPEEGARAVSVVWADGDVEAKYVCVASVASDDDPEPEVPKKFSLKLTAAKGADGSKASLGTTSVAVTLKSGLIWAEISDYLKSNPAEGLSIATSPSGSWYMYDECTALSKPQYGNKASASVTYNLTGPGIFGAHATLDEGNGTVDCSFGGKTVASLFVNPAEEVTEYHMYRLIPKGKKSAKFTVKGKSVNNPTIAAVSASEEPLPCDWVSFASVKPVAPATDKAVVPSDGVVKLGWSLPPEVARFYFDESVPTRWDAMGVPDPDSYVQMETGLRYQLTLASAKADLDKKPLFVTNVLRETSVELPEGLLERSRTYYWRIDYLFGPTNDLQELKGVQVWSFSTSAADAPQVRVASGADMLGVKIGSGVPVMLRQGVKAAFALSTDPEAEGVAYSLASGKLPAGLKLAKDKKTGEWSVCGTPTKTERTSVLIAGKCGGLPCATLSLDFTVTPMGLGAGTFAALPTAADGALTNSAAAMASVTFTSTAAGKLSAKVALAGKTYSFSGAGFDGIVCGPAWQELDEDSEDEELGEDNIDTLTARLFNVVKSGKTAYTNVLELTVSDADAANAVAYGAAAGDVRLEMFVPNASGKVYETAADGSGVVYEGTLYRDNAKISAVATAISAFQGYYTVVLTPPAELDAGVPSGNGYLTVTVDAKGKVKLAGLLADGTKVSASGVPYLTGELQDIAGGALRRLTVPVFVAKKDSCFGGELVFEMIVEEDEEPAPALADRDAALLWNNASPTACAREVLMEDGSVATELGEFALGLTPIGGWYDTVVNLQAYYKRHLLTVESSDEVPENLVVELTGNVPSVDKTSGVTLKFTRATGVVSGKVGKNPHNGILVMNRAEGFLPDNVWSAGSVTWTEKVNKKSVKRSSPFNIVYELVDPDFGAGDEGEWEGEPIPELED